MTAEKQTMKPVCKALQESYQNLRIPPRQIYETTAKEKNVPLTYEDYVNMTHALNVVRTEQRKANLRAFTALVRMQAHRFAGYLYAVSGRKSS